MSDQVTPEVNIAADLARLRDEGRLLSSQELKELNTRVKALEEIAKLEDRLKALENRKQPQSADTSQHSDQQPEYTMDPPNSLGRYTIIRPFIKQDDSELSSLDTIQHYYK